VRTTDFLANIQEAIRKVMANKGACGVDEMEVDELPGYFDAHWPELRKQIVSRKYKPQPVLKGISSILIVI